ncbi:hypothetical protein MKZ38_002448 [Zalerion maritima]|uniref:Uncharacterized protein n=1 Tax=Zalerion maritima TaxID=339359 RepID=A0AAD5RPY9_9PEZI|nr:hypothetical protein MKZ38_002448 [Zalerion maritima]
MMSYIDASAVGALEEQATGSFHSQPVPKRQEAGLEEDKTGQSGGGICDLSDARSDDEDVKEYISKVDQQKRAKSHLFHTYGTSILFSLSGLSPDLAGQFDCGGRQPELDSLGCEGHQLNVADADRLIAILATQTRHPSKAALARSLDDKKGIMVQHQKTVLITGCSPGGIGNALAKAFHARGVHVIATARNPAVLSGLADVGMSTVALDVTKPESVEKCKEEVQTITGGVLDTLVNNAGRTYPMPLTDASLSETRAVMEANVIGPLAMVQAFVPLLIGSDDALIINISSTSDRAPFPFKGVYAMSKAALTAFSRTLSVELHHLDIRVLTVVTGFVSTLLGRRPEDPAQPQLPSKSLFTSMANFMIRKEPEGARMSADEYAKHVVNEALKGRGLEVGPLRLWGRKEWYYIGTSSTSVWLMTSLGERFSKWVIMKIWPFWRLKQAVTGKKD